LAGFVPITAPGFIIAVGTPAPALGGTLIASATPPALPVNTAVAVPAFCVIVALSAGVVDVVEAVAGVVVRAVIPVPVPGATFRARAIAPALPVKTAVSEPALRVIVALNAVETAPVPAVAGVVVREGIPPPPDD
jgi:hypothetical protein